MVIETRNRILLQHFTCKVKCIVSLNTVVIVVVVVDVAVSSLIRFNLIFFHFSQTRLLFSSFSIIHVLYCYCFIGAASSLRCSGYKLLYIALILLKDLRVFSVLAA